MSDTGGEPGPAAAGTGLSQKDERDGLRGPPPGPAGRRRFGWRALVATILIVLGCLLAPVSVLAVWAASEIGNTGRYVATMEPLVHNPAIQNALTDKITTRAGRVARASRLRKRVNCGRPRAAITRPS